MFGQLKRGLWFSDGGCIDRDLPRARLIFRADSSIVLFYCVSRLETLSSICQQGVRA